MRIKRTKEVITGSIDNELYSNILFDELIIRHANISSTTFQNTHFKNSHLGQGSIFTKVIFDKCKFLGKYSSLGSSDKGFTSFKNCTFQDCELVGLDILNGTSFLDCNFSGTFKNIILRDAQNLGTSFINCDLLDTRFENISIYGKKIFRSTQLPKSGLLFLDNKNDTLLKRAYEIYSNITDDSKIESQVIFNPNTKSGQDIIILDSYFLDKFFKSEKAKKVFVEITSGFIITT